MNRKGSYGRLGTRFYYYKLTVDCGGAPSVQNGLLSLAICKPRLRATAKAGDIVIGLAADSIDKGNNVIYVARVWKALADGEYYQDRQYWARPDCIYRCKADRWTQRRNRFHRKTDISRDLGRQRECTQVLLSRDFRYFGRNRFKVDWDRFPALRRKVDRLLQGHRVRHSDAVADELQRLTRQIFRATARKVNGIPTHGIASRCNRDDDSPVGGC